MDWEPFYNRFREPDFVPGYEIQNRLGGGAFGEVYKARKASIGKAFAIKFLKIEGDDQRDAALRELDQVRHFAAIDHPNLVTIEDLGSVMGVPYLIMGYAGEETLAKLMQRGRLEPAQALGYFVQTCRGVLALHDRRLVHFDLKPSNVFVKGDIARVGDYGLSKMMVDGRMTLSFGRGTPQYMAPEILRNRADHRADVYSLGVMLYECLAGKAPFESAVPGALPVRDTDAPPVFPEHFPAPLRRVVERCLRLSPEDRYTSVADLLEDLGQHARLGESVRFELPTAPPVVGANSASSTTTPSTLPSARDARSAAVELGRGAVEVARGMWEGVYGSTKRPAAASPRGAAPRPSTNTTPALRDDASPAERVEVLTARAAHVERVLRSTAPAPGAVAGPATIPVPPAVEGGFLGSAGAAIALSFEVLLALLRSLGEGVSGGLSRAGAASHGRRGFGAACMRWARLALFLVFLLGLGMLVSLAFFSIVRMEAK
ncbi:MAG: protein kinase [Planctomycetes bacterium]|nr:protein kinase [Planctomycetota bacterium]